MVGPKFLDLFGICFDSRSIVGSSSYQTLFAESKDDTTECKQSIAG